MQWARLLLGFPTQHFNSHNLLRYFSVNNYTRLSKYFQNIHDLTSKWNIPGRFVIPNSCNYRIYKFQYICYLSSK